MTTRFKKFIAAAVSAAMVMSSFAVFAANDGVLPKDEVIQSAEAAEPETTASPETPDMSVWDIPTTFGLDSEAAEPMALSADVTASGKCGDNLTWTLDSNGMLTISGTGDMYNYDYRGSDTSLTTAKWGDYKDNLKKLVINDGVTSIGNFAFYGCSGFTGDLIIPNSVTSIGRSAFNSCNGFAGNLIIPNSVTSIGLNTFSGCSGFTGSLIIPDIITSIENGTFSSCSGFTGDLIIPDSVTSIGEQAFYGCSGFTGNLIIPDSVTSIERCAFSDCSGFTGNLIIPDNVTNIGDSVFYGCSGFTGDLIIPDSVTSIERSTFNNCSGFTGNLIIPDSVTNIGDWAFNNCSGFTGDLIIPNGVTSIGYRAFYGCSSFTDDLIIPDSVTSIGDYAFCDCSGFTGDLVISDGVTSIGKDAFSGCSGFTGDLIISGSVTSIGNEWTFHSTHFADVYIKLPEDSFTLSYSLNKSRVHWKYDLSKCTATIKDYTCTGEAIIPTEDSITVTSPNGKTLYYGTDYVITGANNNTNVGTATAHIAPPAGGISIMSQDVPFNIVGIDISGASVTFPNDITWDGAAVEPEPTVILDGKTLVKGTDYTITYSNNVFTAGDFPTKDTTHTATATITGIGNYIGSLSKDFEVRGYKPGNYGDVDISKPELVSATIDGTFVYNGTEHKPIPKLVYHFVNPTTNVAIDYDMVEGVDFEIVEYEDNINAGEATVIVQGIGAFENTKPIFFDISPCEIFTTTIADIPSAEYCKKDICPNPEIKVGDKVMQNGIDYELSYENNRNRGTATVTITGKGNLSGTVTKNFEITPRDGTKFTIVIWL